MSLESPIFTDETSSRLSISKCLNIYIEYVLYTFYIMFMYNLYSSIQEIKLAREGDQYNKKKSELVVGNMTKIK